MTGESRDRAMVVMHCPHGCLSPCSTCENSAAAKELRALRIVADAAGNLVERLVSEGGPIPVGDVAALDRALAAVPSGSEADR